MLIHNLEVFNGKYNCYIRPSWSITEKGRPSKVGHVESVIISIFLYLLSQMIVLILHFPKTKASSLAVYDGFTLTRIKPDFAAANLEWVFNLSSRHQSEVCPEILDWKPTWVSIHSKWFGDQIPFLDSNFDEVKMTPIYGSGVKRQVQLRKLA